MITVDPTDHRLVSTNPGLTHGASVVQLGPVIPTQPSTWLIRPTLPLNSSRNRMPTATGGVMTGR